MERILHCMPGNMDMGGIETFVMNLYRNIDKNKFQFDFIVHKKDSNFFEKEIKKYGGRIYKLPNKSKHLLKYKKIFLKTIEKYSIIHIHGVYAFTYFEAKWAFEAGKKVILHSHNSSAPFKRRLLHYLLKPFQDKYISLRIAPSKKAAEWMFPKKVVQSKKVIYLFNGFETNSFIFNENKRTELRKKLKIKSDQIVIGTVGRLDRQKDPIYTLKIFNDLLKHNNKMILIFVGEGNLKKKLMKLVSKFNIGANVIFTGNISDVSDFLNIFDLFLLPTRYEGLGISIVEAQLNGLSIFTNNNLPQEAIICNHVYLLSKKNKIKWVYEITNFINQKKSLRSDETVNSENYNIIQVTKKLTRIYERLEENC
ncbi:hypothetical protein A7K95_05455 [Pediococcus parvulus]|uniref:Glycosyl transferase family 1 n=1 Tax=Pediococcus parvulus TaxID=54062 RepID=A0ABX2UGG7_9LACO|nr:glycosyltransferase [Pediococcus parvulus]OAD64301.1 hypothetical protein A7K95_05455 [Pediococcus parvulus]